MEKFITLRPVSQSDSATLMGWRNDKTARKNSLNPNLITEAEHQKYITNLLISKRVKQFIFEYNGLPAGTIKEQTLGELNFRLSYQISPLYGGRKLGQIMMSLYLIDRRGSFLCEIKDDNAPSMKMVERLGFKLFKTENRLNFYNLKQT